MLAMGHGVVLGVLGAVVRVPLLGPLVCFGALPSASRPVLPGQTEPRAPVYKNTGTHI